MPPQNAPVQHPAPQQFAPSQPMQEMQNASQDDSVDFGVKSPAAPKPAFEEDAPVQSKQARQSESEIRRRELFEKDEKKKHFPVGILIIVVLLLALAATGVFLYQQGILKFTKADSQIVSQPPASEIPQVQVDDERQTATIEDTIEEEPGEDIQDIPAPVARKTTAPVRTMPRNTPAPQTRAPAAQQSAPASNVISITSLPPGATITIDGEAVNGTTPVSLSNPSAYGEITIEASKQGYQSQKKQVEYAGGTLKEHFVLEREAPPPTTALTEPDVEPEVKPVKKAEPAPVTRTPPPPPPAAPAPAPAAETPPPAPSASSGSGEPGTIFIASIPPVADVYMDGVKIGKTNVEELKVTAGTHSMKFVKGPKEISKDMTFQAGKNASQMVRIP
jgi:hypothetical protein